MMIRAGELKVGEAAEDLRAGVQLAAEAIDSGACMAKLNAWRQRTKPAVAGAQPNLCGASGSGGRSRPSQMA